MFEVYRCYNNVSTLIASFTYESDARYFIIKHDVTVHPTGWVNKFGEGFYIMDITPRRVLP